MDFAVGRDALRLGARLNTDSCGIVFFGGEPLLREDLIRALVAEGRAMADRDEGQFHFKLTTNGRGLDEAFLDFALENGLLVAMSFDGIRAAHDRHRRLPDGSGTFDHLLPRLRLLLAARPYSSVLMVVNPDTVSYQRFDRTQHASDYSFSIPSARVITPKSRAMLTSDATFFLRFVVALSTSRMSDMSKVRSSADSRQIDGDAGDCQKQSSPMDWQLAC
jgi:sulfatase maturation enzyme AslB (radical SAM superfamily)